MCCEYPVEWLDFEPNCLRIDGEIKLGYNWIIILTEEQVFWVIPNVVFMEKLYHLFIKFLSKSQAE